jgi:hypothetical protein
LRDESATVATNATTDDQAHHQRQLQPKTVNPHRQCVQRGEVVVEVRSDSQQDLTIELTSAGNSVDLTAERSRLGPEGT